MPTWCPGEPRSVHAQAASRCVDKYKHSRKGEGPRTCVPVHTCPHLLQGQDPLHDTGKPKLCFPVLLPSAGLASGALGACKCSSYFQSSYKENQTQSVLHQNPTESVTSPKAGGHKFKQAEGTYASDNSSHLLSYISCQVRRPNDLPGAC